MTKKKNVYEDKFKFNAVKELLETDISAVELAKKLNISPNLLRQWKSRFINNKLKLNIEKENLTTEEENIILKSKIESLSNEIKILKKAFTILIKEKK